MALGHALKQRHLDTTRKAPRRPEVDEDDISAKHVRRKGFTIERRQRITRHASARLDAEYGAEMREETGAGPEEEHQPYEIPWRDGPAPATAHILFGCKLLPAHERRAPTAVKGLGRPAVRVPS